MEPVSSAAAIIGIIHPALRTTSALVKYSLETKNASTERKYLAEEAQVLSKLLERLRDRALSHNHDENWLSEHGDIVRQFELACDDFALALKVDPTTGKRKDESRLKNLKNVATWSFTKFEVFALLERITRLQQHANSLLADEQYVLTQRIDQKQQDAADQKLKMSILAWLSPLQMAQVHQTISERAEKGSGKWFLTSKTFLNWREGDSKLLWCSGIPGAGKTVLASIVVNCLRQQRPETSPGKIGIAIIYLRYNEPEQTLENILGSVLKQLAQDDKSTPQILLDLYELHRERDTPPCLDEIFSALTRMVQDYDEVILVLDALDECTEQLRWDLTERIMSLQPKLRFLVTSRYFDAIEEELEEFDRFEIKANRADIELFIDHQIRRNRNLRKLVDRSPSLRHDIKEAVVKTAENMFLLARLHTESLASAAGLSIRHVRQKLKSLPTTLTGTYEAAMDRIGSQDVEHRRLAVKILAWLTYAFRSLSLRELQHALVIDPVVDELDEESIMDGQSITAICAGLVIVDRGTNIVNLVHYTARAYFDETRQKYFPNFHASITLSCAQYLTLKPLQNATIWQLVQEYPLACYAAQYMGDHARQSPEESLEPSVLNIICSLLSHPDKRRPLLALLDGIALIETGFYAAGGSAAQIKAEATLYDAEGELRTLFGESEEQTEQLMVSDSKDSHQDGPAKAGHQRGDSDMSTTTRSSSRMSSVTEPDDANATWEVKISATRIPEVTALHLAASMGLARVASMLLGTSHNIDAVDETGKTALTVAMERGFEKAVEFLLHSGASVDLRNAHGRAVLLLVTQKDWHGAGEIIAENGRVSLDQETDPSVKNQLSMLIAAYNGQMDEVVQVCSNGFLNDDGENGEIAATSIFIAVERGDNEMVQTLLEIGVNPNSKDSAGQTSLHRATRGENEPLIRLLVGRGAKIDCKDDDGRTPWSANIRTANHGVLDLLLELGADPNTRGLQGVSELYTAAKAGETDVVKYMLASGCNPSVKTNYDWTPLHWAASSGHLECVKLLLDAGADHSILSDQNVTALDLTVQANQVEAVNLLKTRGAKFGKEIGEWQGEWVDLMQTTQLGDISIRLADAKMTLVFDNPLVRTVGNEKAVGQFIYPVGTMAPDGFIYQINHYLETPSSGMSIRRATTRATMFEYPLNPDDYRYEDVIYEIRPTSLDYQKFDLAPKNGGMMAMLPGALKVHKEWTGGWKVHHQHCPPPPGSPPPALSLSAGFSSKYLFRTTPDWSKVNDEETRWSREDGRLLARSGWEDSTPNIRFEVTVSELGTELRDALVGCWVAKLWSEHVIR